MDRLLPLPLNRRKGKNNSTWRENRAELLPCIRDQPKARPPTSQPRELVTRCLQSLWWPRGRRTQRLQIDKTISSVQLSRTKNMPLPSSQTICEEDRKDECPQRRLLLETWDLSYITTWFGKLSVKALTAKKVRTSQKHSAQLRRAQRSPQIALLNESTDS